MEPNWLEWARKLNALAQTGLTFAAVVPGTPYLTPKN